MKPARHYIPLLLAALSLSRSSTIAQKTSNACQPALSSSYQSAIAANPDLKDQIELVAEHPVAQWYTDRVADVATLAKTVVLPKCDVESSSPPTVIVYGLPQKDCANGYSTNGSNVDTDTYREFLQQLADATGDRQVVYILEPDAIGLLANGGCGNDKNYAANLGVAMTTLSQNTQTEMYLDVGYWTLSDDDQAAAVAKIVNAVDADFQCKGIALNTANYRSKDEMIATCERFVKASGRDYKCIVDTSRNYVTVSTEWCNCEWAGIGDLPTNSTGSSVVSRFIWAKPAGESDGECTGQSNEALRGPKAGDFFPDAFTSLWNNGIFVHQLGKARIDAAASTLINSTIDVSILTPISNSSPTDSGNATSTDYNRLTTAPELVQVDAPPLSLVVDAAPTKTPIGTRPASDFTKGEAENKLASKPNACT